MRHQTKWMMAAALSACGETNPGTQIGVEDLNGSCELVSSETVTDTASVVAGFSRSLDAALADRTGTFTGFALDASEQPTSDQVSMTIATGTTPARALIYEANQNTSGIEMAVTCANVYEIDLIVDLTSDAVGYSGTITAQISDESIWGQAVGPAQAFDSPPDPTLFDPAEMDVVNPVLTLSTGLDWGVEVVWRAEREDGLGEDGTASVVNELILMAVLTSE